MADTLKQLEKLVSLIGAVEVMYLPTFDEKWRVYVDRQSYYAGHTLAEAIDLAVKYLRKAT